MLWYKSWLETRWRFIIGLAILICSAGAIVFTYPSVMKRLSAASAVELARIDPGGATGDEIRAALAIVGEYRGYIWWEWFRQNQPQMWTILAVLLGSGGFWSHRAGGALFTLSMPVSRARLLGVRAATGLAELVALAVIPALVIPLLSPAVGQSFALKDAFVYSVTLFVGGAIFFSLALLLSTLFTDVWRPPLIAIGVAMLFGLGERVSREFGHYGVFHVMAGGEYFRTGELPWVGLLTSAVASALMVYSATVKLTRRDF